jgi:hypothetical protein
MNKNTKRYFYVNLTSNASKSKLDFTTMLNEGTYLLYVNGLKSEKGITIDPAKVSLVEYTLDQDKDKFDTHVIGGSDCNDDNPIEFPGQNWYPDIDNDGFKDNILTETCKRPLLNKAISEFKTDKLDCNDNNSQVNPSAQELCNDIDDNCDFQTDEIFDKGTNCSAGIGECLVEGIKICSENKLETICNAIPKDPSEEICDNKDNDCDGQIDEEVKTFFYEDADKDSFGDASTMEEACSQPAGYVSNSADCNDNNATINPGATEICNNLNDDCNANTADGVGETWFNQITSCGFGVCATLGNYVCSNGQKIDNCQAGLPLGLDNNCNNIDEDCSGITDDAYVPITNCFLPGVCATGNIASSCTIGVEIQCKTGIPVIEICDNLDNDCDNAVDEDLTRATTCGRGICSNNIGIKTCSSGILGEDTCNPFAGATTETCNGLDDNCDGQIDEIDDCNITLMLNLNSPNKEIYSERSILFNVSSTINFAKLVYSDNRARELTLDTNCYGYARSKSLSEGNHTLFFRGVLPDGKNVTNQTSLFIDFTDPQIFTIKPASRKYTNGSYFYIKYTEANCQLLKILINGQQIHSNNCQSGKNIEKFIPLDISPFNGQEIEYKFIIVDIANNTDESRATKIKIDTTAPEIKDFKAPVVGKYVYFNMTILKEDKDSFNKVEYIDSFDGTRARWKSLCTSLKKDCYKKVSFRTGIHNITVRAMDEAGNSDTEEILITITT